MAVLEQVLEHTLSLCILIPFLYLTGYVLYQRHIHRLAKYPGPFLASLTDLWQVMQFLSLKQPYNLTALHEKYGSVVRYGPDKLSITNESAIPLIYTKGARLMPKTEYYDAFGAAHPNVFGMRDEDMHSLRRRHMAHSFSISYVKQMEVWLDLNMKILREKIARHAVANEAFDLKKAFHYYVIDTLGELAFSQTFGVQIADDEALVPPVVEHSLLAASTGAWPSMLPTLKKWLPSVPLQSLQKLFAGRRACANLASRCVQRRLLEVREAKDDGASGSQRKDILTNLILAKHPDTGEPLTQTDLETEAFGFIIAGTHTTSATTTLLFWHLLHNPSVMKEVMTEVRTSLPALEENQYAYPVTTLESSLPYMRDCIKENFRITPVFSMPLARRVLAPEGVVIDGHHIPQGTSVAVCNHAFHHNPEVWGDDHTNFDPSRWSIPQIAEKARYLMHFGLGGRQCIGKTIAMTNLYKMASTLLMEFDFELADEVEQGKVARGEYNGKLPDMISVGVSDLASPLMVKAKIR